MSRSVTPGAFGTVDISLTAISARINSLPRTLQSLLDQDYADLHVHLYLSRERHLLDAGVPEIPAALRSLQDVSAGRLTIHYCPNWGPYRKLLPYLRAHWGRSRLVATADDDTIYPPHWLGNMLEAYDAYGCVIGYRGHQVRLEHGRLAPYRSWMRGRIQQNPSCLILPTGKDGVLYNTAFFPISVLDIQTALRIAPTVDDLWFRWHLALNRIPAHLISVNYASGSFEEAGHDDSLYLNYNLAGGNDAAVAALESHFSDLHGFRIAELALSRGLA